MTRGLTNEEVRGLVRKAIREFERIREERENKSQQPTDDRLLIAMRKTPKRSVHNKGENYSQPKQDYARKKDYYPKT